MVTMNLTEVEASALESAVSMQLQTLMNDLVHADDRAFREQLKQLVTQLERVQEKLRGSSQARREREA